MTGQCSQQKHLPVEPWPGIPADWLPALLSGPAFPVTPASQMMHALKDHVLVRLACSNAPAACDCMTVDEGTEHEIHCAWNWRLYQAQKAKVR